MAHKKTNPRLNLSTIQSTFLFLLRIAVGWHLLYEGVAKLLTPNWSSAGYLSVSKWIFSGFFHWIAANTSALRVVDFLNIWGLILIGFCLMLGFATRFASISGAVLLLLYYIANPPFLGMDFGVITEGHYLIVDKTLVEILVLCLLAIFPTGRIFGLDRLSLLFKKKQTAEKKETKIDEQQSPEIPPVTSRRELIKSLAALPFVGAFTLAVLKKRGWESFEEKNLKDKFDVVTSATMKTFDFTKLTDLKGQLPRAKIKNLELSRMILGGNLIGGWAHARDLIYVSKLVKAYHHKTKVFETLLLAEKCGVNTILTNPVLSTVINEYWRRKIGKIQFISDCSLHGDVFEGIRVSIGNGAHACYVQGGIADAMVSNGKTEEIGRAVNLIKQNGVLAGIGAHKIETIKKCVEMGFQPDFWVKTIHHTNYWSAKPEEEHDNIWCAKPDETIEFMKNLGQPWIGFKILAAGAIHPKVGFPFAFESGADFICVGMYDFQIVDDVNIALDVLDGKIKRERGWMV